MSGAVMALNTVGACVVLFATLSVSAAKPEGVLTLFQTNTEEVQHVPMKYDSKNTVPKWLEGTLPNCNRRKYDRAVDFLVLKVRNAPALFELGGRSAIHVFDGFAKLHSVEIGPHLVNFSAAFLDSSAYTRSKKANLYAPAITFFGVDPPFSELERLDAFRYPYDNTDVNVWKYGHGEDSVYAALTDGWVYAKFDSDTLATIGVSIPSVSGIKMGHVVQSCAHPIVEPGTTHNINYIQIPGMIPGQKQDHYVLRIKDLDTYEVLASFQTDRASYMHSFALTENYAIFFAQPAYFDMIKIVETAMVSIDWVPEDKTTIILANIKTGETHVQRLQTDAIFFTHHVNAYETADGTIVADVVQFEEGFAIFADFKLPQLRNITSLHGKSAKSRLYRYTIDLANKTVQTKTFRSKSPMEDFLHKIEFPIINENYRTKHYCYVYGVILDFSPSSPLNGSFALVKKDLCTPGNDLYWYHPNHYVSEPSFVADPDGKAEDDGVLLSAVFDAELGKSYLLILDCKTMKAINTAYMPTYIPFGFHGRFFGKDWPV
ncbi:beta,beta-carotene 15,15'-dioxygenase-like [Branchiostoma floridae]|uniref:Beta,beta-carotene 15,15'-dioxygenase-like n=1 Tax=Branchiostoma floridae TaxID=7739 RepID=A0A9J7KIM4_BRAFL|nr:beta,beta-carotene 15,15'-dioxygenase-like [Branchiostoma floridae]